jgi:hypothetical protein
LKNTGWNGELRLIVSMSLADSSSPDATGSAGTGSGSRTGSGGNGGRLVVGVPAAGGGIVGLATGGFGLANPAVPTNAITAMTNTWRLSIIVSALSRSQVFSLWSSVSGPRS